MTCRKCLICMASLMAVCLVLSCATSRKTATKRPPGFVYGVALAKAVFEEDGIGIPQDLTDTFTTKDKQAVAIVRMNNLVGKNKLRWDWHAPNSELYTSSNDFPLVAVAAGKYLPSMTAWHALTICGDMAESLIGQWNVYIYLNDELIERKVVTLIPGENS